MHALPSNALAWLPTVLLVASGHASVTRHLALLGLSLDCAKYIEFYIYTYIKLGDCHETPIPVFGFLWLPPRHLPFSYQKTTNMALDRGSLEAESDLPGTLPQMASVSGRKGKTCF